MEPIHAFQQRQAHFQQLFSGWQRQYVQLSWLRVVVFLVTVVCVLWFANQSAMAETGVCAVIGLSVFVLLMKRHNHVAYQRNHAGFLQQINADEIARRQGKYQPTENGSQYQEATHPYTGDLDIFGRSSLFALLNRTTTPGGNRQLADWLQRPASTAEIVRRQEAVTELATHIDWRQDFQASGMHAVSAETDVQKLLAWLREPARIRPRRWLLLLTYVLPILAISAIVASIVVESVTYQVPLLALFVNFVVLGYTRKDVSEAREQAGKGAKTLKTYARLLQAIETQHFRSDYWTTLRQTISGSASVQIKRLSALLESLEAGQNAVFAIFVGLPLLWDLFWLIRLEKWKARTATDMEKWFAAVSQAEALNSLAGFAYANPDYGRPVVREAGLSLQAENMGHPLILKEKRITNTVSFSGKGKTLIITGSNMSGKSTFLRTIGVNAVLAFAGAPVCATHLEIALCQVFTSMRTQDSLEENTSSFYAELKRLRQLIGLLPEEKPVLYLLDEILKGTNSQDRHAGAQALIRQLHKHNASGFISTHDISLGGMADELPGSAENYSFNSDVVNGKLHFDYTLREGVCRSFNASQLMQQIGIEM